MDEIELATVFSSDNNASKLKLIYEDAENSLKILREDINALNIRLGVLLGFNATFIRIAMDLPAQSPCSIACYSCLLLKTLTFVSVATSVAFSLWGIHPKPVQVIIFPTIQLEKSCEASEELFRERVIEARDKIIHNLLEVVDTKAERFKLALNLLAVAVILAVIDVLLHMFFC
jgi:hypothetical protein